MSQKAANVAVRLDGETRAKFVKMAANYGGTSEVLRELVLAFIDKRIVIQPPALKGTIYDIK